MEMRPIKAVVGAQSDLPHVLFAIRPHAEVALYHCVDRSLGGRWIPPHAVVKVGVTGSGPDMLQIVFSHATE